MKRIKQTQLILQRIQRILHIHQVIKRLTKRKTKPILLHPTMIQPTKLQIHQTTLILLMTLPRMIQTLQTLAMIQTQPIQPTKRTLQIQMMMITTQQNQSMIPIQLIQLIRLILQIIQRMTLMALLTILNQMIRLTEQLITPIIKLKILTIHRTTKRITQTILLHLTITQMVQTKLPIKLGCGTFILRSLKEMLVRQQTLRNCNLIKMVTL